MTKCADCQTRPIDRSTAGRDSTLCQPCWEYAGWENQHSDDDHNRIYQVPECPICHPELDPRVGGSINTPRRPGQVGNQNARGKQRSHSMCGHEKTKAARERCRQASRKTETFEVMSLTEPQPFTLPRDVPVFEKMCPKCGAVNEEKCKTANGGPVKIKGGRHPGRPS